MLLALLKWKDEFGLSEILSLLTLLATIGGFGFAWRQLWHSAEAQRSQFQAQQAQFLMILTERYFADNDARKFYYALENGLFKFESGQYSFDSSELKKFGGSDQERWLDQLLYTFDVIGRVVRAGALTTTEAEIFAFQAKQVLDNEEVKKYLEWLDVEYKTHNLPVPAHEAAKYLVKTLNNCGDNS